MLQYRVLMLCWHVFLGTRLETSGDSVTETSMERVVFGLLAVIPKKIEEIKNCKMNYLKLNPP